MMPVHSNLSFFGMSSYKSDFIAPKKGQYPERVQDPRKLHMSIGPCNSSKFQLIQHQPTKDSTQAAIRLCAQPRSKEERRCIPTNESFYISVYNRNQDFLNLAISLIKVLLHCSSCSIFLMSSYSWVRDDWWLSTFLYSSSNSELLASQLPARNFRIIASFDLFDSDSCFTFQFRPSVIFWVLLSSPLVFSSSISLFDNRVFFIVKALSLSNSSSFFRDYMIDLNSSSLCFSWYSFSYFTVRETLISFSYSSFCLRASSKDWLCLSGYLFLSSAIFCRRDFISRLYSSLFSSSSASAIYTSISSWLILVLNQYSVAWLL